MISYRYLPVFPQERELNPIEPESPKAEAVEETQDDSQAADTLQPAEA